MAFDGMVTKSIVAELNNIIGFKIDKIFEPNKNTITLGLYGKSKNLLLNVCIEAKYCRMHLTTHPKQNPTKAANFCMLLRKYLLGYKIENIYTVNLERIVFIELSSFDNVDKKKLIIELMGKHSNIILVDSNDTIIDSMRHTKISSNSYRDIFPGKTYQFPDSEKANFLNLNSFQNFFDVIPNNSSNIAKDICNLFTGFSLGFIQNVINKFNITDKNSNTLINAFNYIQNLISNIGTSNITILPIYKNSDYCNHLNSDFLELKSIDFTKVNDYVLELSTNNLYKERKEIFYLNFFLDDFYFVKESNEEFINNKNKLLKLVLDFLKKYNKRLENINEKLVKCNDMEMYKLYGELITANLYKLGQIHVETINLENYYDNNNIISISLDKRYSLAVNAKKYFKTYSKLKNALSIVKLQKQETLEEINYAESVIYEIENCKTLLELQDISYEISENILVKKSQKNSNNKKTMQKQKNVKKQKANFSPIKYNIENHIILVGKNNKENDYLTNKYANEYDIWFHTKDIHGSHVILKLMPNEEVSFALLEKCAKIAAKHSKAKNSSNIPVDYCYVKYVKKPNGFKPGMVVYTNNKTLYVTP